MTPSPRNDAAKNVLNSARTAAEVLAHFETALRDGGFEKGVAAYEQLAETLLNQYLWSGREAPSDELTRAYQAVGARARRLYGVLHAYAAVMMRLAALDAVAEAAAEPPASVDPLSDILLKLLRSGEASLTALRSRSLAKRSDVDACIARLELEGLIVSRVSSGRRLFRLR